jgi:hypothetical protein
MAAVEVTISGVLYDKVNRTTQNVVLIGEATLTGLGVGGGPMPPGPGQPPPNWGPGGPPQPAHPIWGGPGSGFPDKPGYPPVVGGGPIVPPPGGGGPNVPPHPAFPIWGPPGVTFPPGSGYPPVVGGGPIIPDQPPPEPIVGWEAKTFWTPETGWGVVIVPKEGTLVPTPSK